MRPQPSAEPHHDGSPLYVSTQTPALGKRVQVRVRVPRQFGAVTAVYARSNPDRKPRFSAAHLLGTVDGARWGRPR
ncbi:hypothetical protein [Cryobacterium sp. GrIS_2_6]|uniref:hypothetical protein n=1 Tax=Cryobacterium sp. GrIS_2_6 TaxID=3162785 RepID=UPI002E031263|nr:hypothetical protein [Cryobacterium psychrotolerans]